MKDLPPGFHETQPEEVDRRTLDAYERFRQLVTLQPDPVKGCLEWRGPDTFWNGVAHERPEHFAYRQMEEELPMDRVVLQACGNTRCVRLDHLVLA